MMIEDWRTLLYPLGFLSALAFGCRMLVQWIRSEAQGKSVVSPLFWKLSLCGNTMLLIHAFIQAQFHICLVQACNAVISWRNLNLMQPLPAQRTTKQTIAWLCAAAGGITLLFFLQGYLLPAQREWFRIPATPWQANATAPVSLQWHLIGFFGLLLFNSRFWIQWWSIELAKVSYLGSAFWWVSLVGESLCLVYFARIEDPVNFIGPALGLIPYIRNLMLIHKSQKRHAHEPG